MGLSGGKKMRGQAIRTGLLGLVLLLGLSLAATAWAGDAELFVGLVPGTVLTDEELEQHYGRGLDVASLTRFSREEARSLVETMRERVRELLAEIRVELVREDTEILGMAERARPARPLRIPIGAARDRLAGSRAAFRPNF
jgi:hypothetical protein